MVDYFGKAYIIDLSDPVNPKVIAGIKSVTNANSLGVSGSRLFVADYTGITVFDIHDPAHPVETGRIDLPGGMSGMQVVGQHLCGYDFQNGLVVYDITTPESPRLLGSIAVSSTGNLTLLGNYAYVGFYDVGAAVYDLSDPANIHVVATAPSPLAEVSSFSTYELFRGRYMYSCDGFYFQTTRLW